MQKAFSIAREISHSALAVISALAGSQALVLTFLSAVGIHVSSLDFSQKAGAVGAVALAVSKWIDSHNNAVTTSAIVAASGRPPV